MVCNAIVGYETPSLHTAIKCEARSETAVSRTYEVMQMVLLPNSPHPNGAASNQMVQNHLLKA